MPLVFIDASSAILLYKTDLFTSCARAFTMAMAEEVFREITIPGYPGAGYFKRMEEEKRIRILGPVSGKTKIQGTVRLDKGELETLLLFISCRCRDAFIIMDDGKGARYCRDQDIPFINALLVPKIFWYAGRMNTETWTRRGMAFAVRSHNHLWGKNNEGPLVFLFRHGLNHEFSRSMYLGWNKFGQERPYEGWGIPKPGKFLIPAGIVFPYIIEKELTSLFIIPMNDPERIFSFPGNPDSDLILGDPEKPVKTEKDLLQGLALFQENCQENSVRIVIGRCPAAENR